MKPFWKKEEIDLLIKIYSDSSHKFLLENFPNYTIEQILSKGKKLKLNRSVIENCGGKNKGGKFYSEDEISFIKENYIHMTSAEIANILGRGESSISNKINELDLSKKVDKWTLEEIKTLKRVYPLYENKIIHEKFLPNRSVVSILKKAKHLKIEKSDNKKVESEKISREYAIECLLNLSKKLGRTPIHSELVPNGLPSLPTYRVLFGNYTNACFLAGLTPNFSKIGLGRKSVLLSKNNDVCYSIYEQIITNFFIDNKISYRKEERYSNHSEDKRCKTKRTDWILEDNTFVEYWGFPEDKKYRENMNIKISICKKSNIKLIQITIKEINNLNQIFKKYIN